MTTKTSMTSKTRRRPIVFRTPEEKEARLQALRNRIPEVIVTLIISFVNFNPTFQAFKDELHTNHFPWYKQVGYYYKDSWLKSILSMDFQYVGRFLQGREGKDSKCYEVIQEKMLKVIGLFQAEKNSSKNVFYTKNIKSVDGDELGMFGLCFQSLICEFYEKIKPDFTMDYKDRPCEDDINLKITAKGTAQKKAVINFFKAIGRFTDWVKYEALPIYYSIPEGLPRMLEVY